jgi:bifunctional DNase/RNase
MCLRIHDRESAVTEVIIERLIPDSVSEACVVVLREKHGVRLLPIWIGALEARSIADAMQHVHHKRPLTHDLCMSIIVSLGGALQGVHITRVQDDTYYAQLRVLRGGETMHVDARPSDSLAIAVRMGAPIFAEDALLATVDVGSGSTTGPTIAFSSGPPKELTAEQLKAHLQKLRPEDFGKFSP